MHSKNNLFSEENALHLLKHYLPAQAPLKDFVHHNTLHAYQHLKFEDGIKQAAEIFGYKVSLSLIDFRKIYADGKISEPILQKVIKNIKGENLIDCWKEKAINYNYDCSLNPRIGQLRNNWKEQYHINLDSLVHPILFRVLCSYLDQGIAIWSFPTENISFLEALKELERNSYSSFFKSKKIKNLFLNGEHTITSLLKTLIGEEALYEQYIFDQQFAHQGWSGMVASIELEPQSLLNTKVITLNELIIFELLLEIDALDYKFGVNWAPLGTRVFEFPKSLFDPIEFSELDEVIQIWQKAFEWTYYDQVITAIQQQKIEHKSIDKKSFQALFCIDDRECSIRRYLENNDPNCETFGTPGFFGVEFFYQPEDGKFYTKQCPAPVTPKYLIKEGGTAEKRQKVIHLSKQSHGLLAGWFITQTIGFWSAIKLFFNIFQPKMSPSSAYSFRHMNKIAPLSIAFNGKTENNLQIGFTIDEMAIRVENLLKSIGLIKDFAPVVYIVGHGSSSVNNPHFAAYDCGACSGRPGSVNARVICFMANNIEVRAILAQKGLNIPNVTQFVGCLHDTTRDEILFYDIESLNHENAKNHLNYIGIFEKSLDLNAKERSRRFESIDTHVSAVKIHEKILLRSVSLFEPRPELNHATNALCIVGRRELTKDIFLDRRSFMNSYDYTIDPEGKYLLNILNAAAPVCGGINLEYFFSRVDNQKLGAGTKLPHNVMGLIGVANGIDGDLRPGLPSQMIEVHDPIRLMIVVEHYPETVLSTIQKNPNTYEWFVNEWVVLTVIHPKDKSCYYFENGQFYPYFPISSKIETINDINTLLTSSQGNLPVYLLNPKN